MNFRKHNHFDFKKARWIIIIGLLIGAFFYYSANSLVGFVIVLDYPVSSIAYWIGVIMLGFIIYKITE